MKVYNTPDMEVFRLSAVDVILTSAGTETPIIDTEEEILG